MIVNMSKISFLVKICTALDIKIKTILLIIIRIIPIKATTMDILNKTGMIICNIGILNIVIIIYVVTLEIIIIYTIIAILMKMLKQQINTTT